MKLLCTTNIPTTDSMQKLIEVYYLNYCPSTPYCYNSCMAQILREKFFERPPSRLSSQIHWSLSILDLIGYKFLTLIEYLIENSFIEKELLWQHLKNTKHIEIEA